MAVTFIVAGILLSRCPRASVLCPFWYERGHIPSTSHWSWVCHQAKMTRSIDVVEKDHRPRTKLTAPSVLKCLVRVFQTISERCTAKVECPEFLDLYWYVFYFQSPVVTEGTAYGGQGSLRVGWFQHCYKHPWIICQLRPCSSYLRSKHAGDGPPAPPRHFGETALNRR